MAPQLYLITPADPDPARFTTTLMAVLNAAEVSALLVRRGDADEAGYGQRARELINIGQGAGSAVLLENDAALAKRLNADGVHMTDGPEAVSDAILTLKPNFIVGASSGNTRHDAMTLGEMDVDYVFFGPLEGERDDKALELAEWWASTFEIPAVLSDPAVAGPKVDSRGAEFLALSSSVWLSPSPAEAMRAIAAALKEHA
jgi:thiamine-phosphate pyrophosphorylase